MKKIQVFFMVMLLLSAVHAGAALHTIQVGVSNGFTFMPNSINPVAIGDVIQWVWVSGTHTTTSVSVPSGANTWNSNITSGSTSFSYTVTTAGTYNYQCTPHGAGGMTGSFVVAGATPVLEKTSLVYTSFEISPNPTSEVLAMKFSADQNFKATLLVFDSNGKEKMSKKIDIQNGENTHSFPISNLPKGVYYLTLMEGSTSFISKKFIKE